jgi:hypothetical protein
MSSAHALRPVTQRKSCLPVTGRLVTGAGLQDLFNEAAVLSLYRGDAEQLYWCGVIQDGGRVVSLTLRKFGTGELYRVVLNPDSGAWECECGAFVYGRRGTCKHIEALHAALTAATEGQS